MGLFFLLVIVGGLAVLQAMLLGRTSLWRLRYSRTFSRLKAFEGDEIEMIEVLENRKLLPVTWLRVESRMPPELQFGAQENLDIAEERYHRSIFFMGPFRRVTRRHKVRLLRRGYYDLSSAALTGGDLFGLGGSSRTLSLSLHITVYPRILAPRDWTPPSTRFMGDVLVRRFILPDLFLIQGIRPFRPGDAPRDVHWGATARLGELQVKQHDFTASPKLMVLLNIQTAENLWGEVGERDVARIEEAIRQAAAILMSALDQGIESGFGCNGELRLQKDQTVYVPPMASEQQRAALLETLAQLVLRRVKNFHTYLELLPAQTGMDYLVLSPYTSDLVEERMAALRGRGNTCQLLPW